MRLKCRTSTVRSPTSISVPDTPKTDPISEPNASNCGGIGTHAFRITVLFIANSMLPTSYPRQAGKDPNGDLFFSSRAKLRGFSRRLKCGEAMRTVNAAPRAGRPGGNLVIKTPDLPSSAARNGKIKGNLRSALLRLARSFCPPPLPKL